MSSVEPSIPVVDPADPQDRDLAQLVARLAAREREVRAMHALLAFQHAVTDVLVSATTRTELLPRLLDALRSDGHCRLATFWDLRPAAPQLAAIRGADTDGVRALAATLGLPPPLEARACSITTPDDDPRFEQAGVRSVLRFPVCSGDATIAVIELFDDRPPPHDDPRLEIAQQIGTKIGDTLRRIDQVRESEDARRRAEEATRAKSTFLATMCHEIRTPLNGVLGLTSLLLDSSLSAQQRTYAETAHRAGGALLALLDDVLDLSKIEAGRLEVERIAFDPSRVIDDVIGVFAHVAHTKKLALDVRVAPSAGERVLGDPTRLRQILFNLVGNAVKFTVTGTVSVTAESPTPGRLRVSVADTGIGIASSAVPDLFQPFAQTDVTMARRFGGAGLGLSIAQHLASLLGGHIELTSTVGVGSTFVLDVPAERASPSRPPAPAPEQPLPKLRVIVVDDQRVNLLVAAGMLERLGQQVTTASSGREALERLKTEQVDLVFMDCLMPELDGYDTARALRATGFDRPIVAFTARERQFEAHAFRAAGMDDIITKPATQRDMARVIRAFSERA